MTKQLTQANGQLIRMAVASALALGASTLSVNSYAGSDSSSMTVTATVNANCTITAGTLNFDTYDPIVTNAATPKDGTATLNVKCTLGSAPKIMLGEGTNKDPNSTAADPVRRMKAGSNNYLSYQLYKDVAGGVVWGDTDGTHVNYTGTGLAGTVTVYGRVGFGQNVPAGTYTDTVLATINF